MSMVLLHSLLTGNLPIKSSLKNVLFFFFLGVFFFKCNFSPPPSTPNWTKNIWNFHLVGLSSWGGLSSYESHKSISPKWMIQQVANEKIYGVHSRKVTNVPVKRGEKKYFNRKAGWSSSPTMFQGNIFVFGGKYLEDVLFVAFGELFSLFSGGEFFWWPIQEKCPYMRGVSEFGEIWRTT